jgi:hypothetical protein
MRLVAPLAPEIPATWIVLEETMSSTTSYLSRLIGLYCILAALFMFTHKQLSVDTVTALLHSPMALFVTGLLTILLGLAMILGHNVWSGTLPVVVTLIGWATLVKGLVVLFLSPTEQPTLFLGELHYARLFYFYTAVSLALGLYLTVAGSRSAPRRG